MNTSFGSRELRKDLRGPDVVELQCRLAGFRGTLLDGEFGSGTELQVQKFQEDFMRMKRPTRVVDRPTFEAIDEFAARYPIDFAALACRCGRCGGFGRGLYKGQYLPGGAGREAFHRYEYPGIHRMLLWAVRAIFFYVPDRKFEFSSGYRCSIDNERHGRTTTNHCGKAVDLDMALEPGETRRDDMAACEAVRGLIVARSNAQIGWAAMNRKAFEPASVAPTWVHYDVRQYEPRYLADEFFCKDLATLNGAPAQ